MRLELETYHVRQVQLTDRSSFGDGVLSVNREELLEILTSDASIARAEVNLAFPGEATRIVHVLDTLEPRYKAAGHGRIFPGLLGPPDTVGSGRTHRLQGVALVVTARFPQPVSGLLQPREAIVDMSGPAALYSPFSETINLVVTFHPAPDVDNVEFDQALRLASLRAAEALAGLTRDLPPDDLQTFELTETDPTLPRIAYLYQAQSQGIFSDTYLYGRPIENMVPTLIHPNEVMDGALVSGNYVYACFKNPTYLHCNNPVIQELYAQHGRSLTFAGVVLYRGHNYTQAEKQRAGNYTAKLASFLRADGAILTGEGGGNSAIDMMLALQECERLGIKTTVITYELGGPEGRDFPLVHGVPEADAIVSTGSVDRWLELPAAARVLGGDTYLDSGRPAGEARELSFDFLYCLAGQFGAGRLMAQAY
ncbi:MAG: glycine/sarcosine/betaine reductase component B subunit [Ardenticatenaceae bacterium]|nr:glycine/sarcosine/betaine reductase component B subunit [Ardenticatenaceae bacterium]